MALNHRPYTFDHVVRVLISIGLLWWIIWLLNPAMIMLSLSIWGKLPGLLGRIIALPLTDLLLVYYRQFLASVKPASASSIDT